MMKRAVRCDDPGSFQAANRAIADATERGLARNAGIMVQARAIDWQALVHPQILATCRELNIQPVKVTEL
ncbi:MAG: hypothetical protein WC058_06580 [Phycisphaeraceae bacterium]